MADLVNGLGGAAGFGEDSMGRGNIHLDPVLIDLSTVFPGGLTIKGTTFSSLELSIDAVAFWTGGLFPAAAIAPFLSTDVDTRFEPEEWLPSPGGTSRGSNLIWWDLDAASRTFTVTWDDVSNLNAKNGPQNAYQLQIVAVGSEGEFDIHFRYETVQWLKGFDFTDRNASAVYWLGAGSQNFFSLPQSGTTAMFSLPGASNIGEPGHFVFEVRNAALFSGAADIVDFNNLTADQKTAIADGKDEYHGLGGSDTVFLPNQANYQQVLTNGGITLNWDSKITFVAGDTAGQKYLITGGDGSDTIKLGDGDDTVFASPGNDLIEFGSGENRFDYRSGSFAKFSGFAAGTQQTIAYHSAFNTWPPKTFQTDSARQSTLELPGSPSDYDLMVSLSHAGNTDFGKAQLVVKTSGATFTPLTINTYGIERVTYTDPKIGIKNTVVLSGTQIGPGGSQGTLAAETMKLVDEVYSPGGFQTLQSDPLNHQSPSPRSAAAKTRGWHLLQAAELGMAPADFGQHGTLVFTFIDGLYAAYDTGDREDEGSYSQANAFALVGMVNGKRTLSVDFRGTDQGLDFFNFFTFSAHYAKFAPLIAALRSYADNPDNGIEQVLVAGHSLGAGMTGYFLRDFAAPRYNLIAYTDGSPGFENASADSRIINFIHPHDAVAWLPNINGPNSNPLIKAALVATAVTGIVGGLAASSTGVGAGLGLAGLGAGGLSLILATMEPKFTNGTTIYIDDVYSHIGLEAHNSTLYANEVALLSQLAFDASSPFAQDPLAAALRDGTYYAGPSLRIALSHDGAGNPGSGWVRANPEHNYVLGGFGNSKIVLDASDFLSTFLLSNNFDGPPIKIDGGPGGALVVLVEGESGGFGMPVATGNGSYLLPYVFPNSMWGALTGAPNASVDYASLYRVDAILNLGRHAWGTTNGVVDTRGYHKLDGNAANVQKATKAGGLIAAAMVAQEAGLSVSALPELVVDPSFDYTDAGDESLLIIGSGTGDIIALGSGDSTVVQTAGDNFIYVKDAASAGDLTISGGSGNDTIVVGHGTNVVTGGAGHDTIVLTGGQSTLTGGAGADKFVIGGGTIEITDLSFDDVLIVNNANAVVLSQNVANSKLTVVLDVTGTGAAGATLILDNVTRPLIKEVSGPTSTFHLTAMSTTSAGGYLSGATLIADIDADDVLDAGEDSVMSDGNGIFVLGAADKGQYVATGGIDGFTGLPFAGRLTAPLGAQVITPLTTLVNAVMRAGGGDLTTAENSVRSALGLDPSLSLVGADPVGQTSLGDAPYRVVLGAAVKIVDTAVLVAATLSGIKGDADAIFGDTTSAIGTAIKSLAGGQAFDLDDQNTLRSLITSVAMTEGITINAAAIDSLAAVIADSNQAVGDALKNDPGTSTLRAVETIAQGELAAALHAAGGDAAKIGSAVTAFTGANLDTLIVTEKGQLPVLPTMLSLTATTDNNSALVRPGNIVTITLTTSKAMDVAGIPTLQLDDNQVASYARGSGSTQLVFTYTVQPLDNTPNLAVVGLHTPLGTVIQDSAGAQLSGPVAGSLGIQVGAAALVITSIRATVDGGGGIAERGDVVTVHVNTNAPTTVQGAPTLQLSDQRVASYVGGSGSTTLSFAYTVRSSDNTPNLGVIGLDLPQGAAIEDAVGNRFAEPLTAMLGVQLVSPTIVSIAAAGSVKAEGNNGATDFTFTLTRSDGASEQIVTWAVAGAGAAPATAADFAGGVLLSGAVTFAVGEMARTIAVAVHGDGAVEGDESFVVTLANPSSGLVIETATAGGTIVDDDATVSVAASNAATREGHSGATLLTFTLTRSGDLAAVHGVSWSVAGSGVNAASASDFVGGVLASGGVTFLVGETTRTIAVEVAGDADVEADETFTLSLSGPTSGLTVLGGAAEGTIVNDDAVTSVLATNAAKAEGNGGTTGFNFTVTRAGDISVAHSVSWSVTGSGSDPASAADFVGGVFPTGSVTFAAGEVAAIVTVLVDSDSVVEAGETFTIALSAPSSGLAIGTASAVGSIGNDDATVSIAVAGSPGKPEGNAGPTPFAFTLTRAGDTSTAHSVAWSVTASTATPADADDFASGVLSSGTVTFAAGEASRTVIVDVEGDIEVESNDGFAVELSAPSPGLTIVTATAGAIIANDDARISIAAAGAVKTEGNAGATAYTFALSRSGDLSVAHSVTWGVVGSGGSPATASDFVGGALPSASLTFAVAETSRVVTVSVQGDTAAEADEGFTVTLTSPSSGATIGTAAATGTIQNDDIAVVKAYDDAFVGHQGKAVVATAASGVLFNDVGATAASIIEGPDHGTLQLAGNGSFTYTPSAGFTGIDAFTYQASNGSGGTGTAEAVVHVVPVLVGATTTLDLLALTAEEQIAATYAAFFGRAADAAGFVFWVGEFNAGLPVQGAAALFANIASSFGIGAEARALYPFLANPSAAGDDQIAAFLQSVYNNLFNRGSDPAGLAYWTGQIKQTLQAGQFVGSVLVNIMGGAQDSAAGQDITTLMGKVAVSLEYVQEQIDRGMGWAGDSDRLAATSLLQAVTSAPQTVLTGIRSAEDLVAAHP